MTLTFNNSTFTAGSSNVTGSFGNIPSAKDFALSTVLSDSVDLN